MQGGTSLYAMGQYVNAKWRTVDYFCYSCFQDRIVKGLLLQHADECGCQFQLHARSGHGPLPFWIRMPDTCSV